VELPGRAIAPKDCCLAWPRTRGLGQFLPLVAVSFQASRLTFLVPQASTRTPPDGQRFSGKRHVASGQARPITWTEPLRVLRASNPNL
jgi:hypothetical protein